MKSSSVLPEVLRWSRDLLPGENGISFLIPDIPEPLPPAPLNPLFQRPLLLVALVYDPNPNPRIGRFMDHGINPTLLGDGW